MVMISRRRVFAVVGTALIVATTPAWAASSLVGQFDLDKDGSVDLAEAKKAAAALFDKLDVDKKGVLTQKQLRGRVSSKAFAAADADKDGTLSKDEYLTIVEQRFNAADANHDGKLVNFEFHTPQGKALTKLLR
jgi:Ca2+-binding EF-hand superfamily protein